jgi:hypothetical protein
MRTKRVLLWAAMAALGLTATLTASFGGGPMAVPFLLVATVIIVKVDKLVALSGLLVGFGASWLALVNGQATAEGPSGGSTVIQSLIGAVPLLIGLLALMPLLIRALRRPGLEQP